MIEITLTEARKILAALVDHVHDEPIFLTRRNRTVAVIVDADELKQLRADASELADIRAVDTAWQDAEQLNETPIPWDDVKRDLGLVV